jgi:hypothetical protein
MIGLLGRTVFALILLIPVAVVDLRAGQPFAISAIASTAAIVLHAPKRYQRRPQVIIGCYLVALAVAVPITLGGVVLAWPTLITASVAAALIAATSAARTHPPAACIPMAIVSTTDPASMVMRWALFVAAAVYSLAVLWLLTLSLRTARDEIAGQVKLPPNDRRDATR